jgi:hypothetical protein
MRREQISSEHLKDFRIERLIKMRDVDCKKRSPRVREWAVRFGDEVLDIFETKTEAMEFVREKVQT